MKNGGLLRAQQPTRCRRSGVSGVASRAISPTQGESRKVIVEKTDICGLCCAKTTVVEPVAPCTGSFALPFTGFHPFQARRWRTVTGNERTTPPTTSRGRPLSGTQKIANATAAPDAGTRITFPPYRPRPWPTCDRPHCRAVLRRKSMAYRRRQSAEPDATSPIDKRKRRA